jgi:hypothetical protein
LVPCLLPKKALKDCLLSSQKYTRELYYDRNNEFTFQFPYTFHCSANSCCRSVVPKLCSVEPHSLANGFQGLCRNHL